MKKRSQKLSKIVSLASSEERRCGAETGRSRRKLEEQMAKLGEPPHTCDLKQRAMTSEGWRWLDWSDTAVLDDDGAIDYVIAVGRDISTRKELEEQLRLALQPIRQNYKMPPYFTTPAVDSAWTAHVYAASVASQTGCVGRRDAVRADGQEESRWGQ